MAGAFLVQGMVFIALTTKLPAIQDKFGLSPLAFSGLMLMLVLCAGVGSLSAEWLAPRRGSALGLRVGFVLIVIALPVLGLSGSLWGLGLAMAVYGLGLGMVDAGTNMQGVALEHDYGRPIMPTFHGAWTLGGILGTLVSLATKDLSLGASATILVVLPLLILGAPLLKVGGVIVPIGDDGAPVPWRRILLVGAAIVLFYMVDTATTTWGPTYLDKTFGASNAIVAVATLPYLLASLAARGLGDGLTARFGAAPLLRGGTLIAVVGLATVVFAPAWPLVMVGFLILGTGIAVIAPLSYSAAALIARESVDSDDPIAVRAKVDAVIARFNQFNYLGAILGSVMTGAVGNDSLRYGFAVPMILVLGILPLAKHFGNRRTR
ncbi:MFS transporter [Leekyejoonella antrihumi]|uniref:MFS transporter n=1 Tax=Leekyejoonella antrihumi TaxID=1660198 RepID=A0A563E6J5_9MICO|nr:MFS transporter [Leekyejoonella antrihumi]